MRGIWCALAVALVAGPASASDKSDALAVVHQFADDFNKGDAKGALALCASPAAIIDEIAPYAWQGPMACADWAHDFDTDAKARGITEPMVTVGKVVHDDITGDRAYVVVPTTYSYKLNGKPTKETGATLTVVLQKSAEGWRITSWAWTKH